MEKQDIKKWKEFVFKKIRENKNNRIFVLRDNKLEKQIQDRQLNYYRKEIEYGRINIELLKEITENNKTKNKIRMVIYNKIVTDIKSFLFCLRKEKITDKKIIEEKYRRFENW